MPATGHTLVIIPTHTLLTRARVQAFISSFPEGRAPESAEPDSEADGRRVQEFLRLTEGAFRGHTAWRGASEDELDASGEGLEKYLMTKLYPQTFAVMTDDRRVDALLSRRIAALSSFVRPEHLDIPEHFRVEASWLLAQNELIKVNNFKAPRDKLVCILNTCRIINNLLNVSAGNRPPGADDFLPVLIYVVLHANPPQLESNLRYIARFRLESRLVSEAAYFYTNLVSATHFLTTCDHSAFTGLSKELYDTHMAGLEVGPSPATVAQEDASGWAVTDAATAGREEDSRQGGNTASVAEKMLREGAPVGPATPKSFEVGPNANSAGASIEGLMASPTLPAVDPQTQRQLWSALQTDRARLERELADARGRLSVSASSPAPTRSPPSRWWHSVEDVEAEGAATLAAEDAAGTLRLPYKFLYARSDDLQVGDVPSLLHSYKSLALQYEALARGTAAVLTEAAREPGADAACKPTARPHTTYTAIPAAANAASSDSRTQTMQSVETPQFAPAAAPASEEMITVMTPTLHPVTARPPPHTPPALVVPVTASGVGGAGAVASDTGAGAETLRGMAGAPVELGPELATGCITSGNSSGGTDLFDGMHTSPAGAAATVIATLPDASSASRVSEGKADPFAQLVLPVATVAGDTGVAGESRGPSDPFADLARMGNSGI